MASVVVLEIKGTPDVEPMLLSQAADGTIRLPASEAILHGKQIQAEGSSGSENLGHWTNAGDYAQWQFKVIQPGTFDVTAESCPGEWDNYDGNWIEQAGIPGPGDRRLSEIPEGQHGEARDCRTRDGVLDGESCQKGLASGQPAVVDAPADKMRRR